MSQVSVIGAGSWGTALAIVLADNGHQVTMWAHRQAHIEELALTRENRSKLPGVILPENIQFTTSLEEAVKGKEMIVLAVPSTATRKTSRDMAPWVTEGQLIVTVSKGIEEETLMIQTQIIEDELPKARVAVLSGPSHAEEVGRHLPTTVVSGAADRKTAEQVQSLFMNEVFRVYTSSDLLGIELGGSLKNVIALSAGMADGLGFGDNTKAALITRGIAEIGRLAIAMGANPKTISGLSGIGDLIVTCASQHSRNRKAGYLMGQGYTMQEAMDEVQMVVEGVYSAKAAIALGHKYGVEMPITEQVNEVLFGGQTAKAAVLELMLRNKKSEYEKEGW